MSGPALDELPLMRVDAVRRPHPVGALKDAQVDPGPAGGAGLDLQGGVGGPDLVEEPVERLGLGVDAGPDKFLAAVKEKNATHIAMSALLTTTMPQMKNVIDALSAEGLRDKVKVMIGGAPITQQYADEIGADGYSENAAGAVTIARQLAAAL